jgi:hypothetical protein
VNKERDRGGDDTERHAGIRLRLKQAGRKRQTDQEQQAPTPRRNQAAPSGPIS